jgi:hypothetical protein
MNQNLNLINKYLVIVLLTFLAPVSAISQLQFEISFDSALESESLDGRLLLMISKNAEKEPRFQIMDRNKPQQVFGIDVNSLGPGEKVIIDAKAFGFPLASLSMITDGEYYIQALLHRYETFHRSDGHVVKLPMDRGEGQQWNKAPGNLYSTVVKKSITRDSGKISIVLDKKIPAIEPPKDTKYIKHIRMKSELLSKFWGRLMYLGAHILLPEGFDSHPDAHYPLVVSHGHFSHDFDSFREEPPDPNLKPEFSERFQMEGYNRTMQEYSHQFYKEWTGPDFPRVIVIEIQHANPYYDDSYAVNSENLGPYGDAITYELIPHIEEKFRGLGAGWARFLYGGSTGGWEALAAQVFYPDEYNGCYAACPDPVDFRAYGIVNIYKDKNAYYRQSDWGKVPKPAARNYLGEIFAMMQDVNHRELALGTKSRSGLQWDIWEAVYSPVGDDGYPKRIWDKFTGEIDPKVAEFWRENYDLRYILERDWSKIGDKLAGKINVYCGDMDNYYLNNAVYYLEEFLQKTKDPYYGGEVDYGDRAEHCWNGDHTQPNGISRLRYHQMFIPRIVERIRVSAPAGADTSSWKY